MLESFTPNPGLMAELEISIPVQVVVKKKAAAIVKTAKNIFEGKAVHSHKETGRKYVNSFEINVSLDHPGGWIVINHHPAAVFVEFGAHPGGGGTFAEGYNPLRGAIDSLTGSAGGDG